MEKANISKSVMLYPKKLPYKRVATVNKTTVKGSGVAKGRGTMAPFSMKGKSGKITSRIFYRLLRSLYLVLAHTKISPQVYPK